MTTDAVPSTGPYRETRIVPPIVVLRIIWALTGKWSGNPESRKQAQNEEDRLKDLKKRAEESGDSREKAYVEGVISIINSGLRDLGIIYEGRNKNFEEVDTLRSAQFESIEHYSKLTGGWQSAWPRLSAGGIGGISGAIGLSELVEKVAGNTPDWWTGAFTIGGVGVSYILHEWIVVPLVKRAKMKDIIKRDYDRNLYYDQYVDRSRLTLRSIYRDLERLHASAFRGPYDGTVNEDQVVNDVMAGAPSTMCPHVHRHTLRGLITPDLWSMCETGNGKETCPYWPTPLTSPSRAL